MEQCLLEYVAILHSARKKVLRYKNFQNLYNVNELNKFCKIIVSTVANNFAILLKCVGNVTSIKEFKNLCDKYQHFNKVDQINIIF